MFYLMDAMSPDFDRRGLSGIGERSTQHAATHCAYGNKGLACGILSGKVVNLTPALKNCRSRRVTCCPLQKSTGALPEAAPNCVSRRRAGFVRNGSRSRTWPRAPFPIASTGPAAIPFVPACEGRDKENPD